MSDPRLDPRKQLNSIRDSVGRVIEQGIQSVQTAAGGAAIKLDIYELNDEVIVRSSAFDGLDAQSIEVSMEGDVLTINGQTHAEETPAGASFLLQERRFGPFTRSVTIPIAVKSNEARAKLKNNILTITLPVDRNRQDIAVAADDTE